MPSILIMKGGEEVLNHTTHHDQMEVNHSAKYQEELAESIQPNLRSLRAFINHSVKLLQRSKTNPSIPSTLGSVKFLATTKPSHPCSRKRPIINHDQSALTILGLATIKCKAKYLLLGLSIYQELSQKTPNQPCSNCTKDKAARPHEEVKGLKPNATTRDHQSITPLQTKGCP
ncbi:unnamed protein product [Cochlearia groenlandica]